MMHKRYNPLDILPSYDVTIDLTFSDQKTHNITKVRISAISRVAIAAITYPRHIEFR
jgi:hypothetical protein